MIYDALDAVCAQLNTYFKNRFSQVEDRVLLSNLVDPDGSNGIKEDNKVVMTLVNVERESISGNRSSFGTSANKPVALSLYVLFSAWFVGPNYPEALKFLGAIVSFFQANNVITASSAPELPEGIDKLSFEYVNLDFEGVSRVWGILGAKHMPSVMYKCRLVLIDEQNIKAEFADIRGASTSEA